MVPIAPNQEYVTRSEVATLLGCSNAQATRILAKLRARGLGKIGSRYPLDELRAKLAELAHDD